MPVEIPVAFIGHADGLTLVDWAASHPGASLSVHFGRSQAIGGTPDIIAGSSSRGPGIGNVLKPDITAPGVNILSQA